MLVRMEFSIMNTISTFCLVPLHEWGLEDRHNLVHFLCLEEGNLILHFGTNEVKR